MRTHAKFAAVAIGGLALMLGACGGGETVTEVVEVPVDVPAETTPAETAAPVAEGDNVLTIWVDETRYGPVRAAADEYIAANPGTVINLVQKNFDDIRTDFISQVPTGEGPDITVCAHDWTGELVANGVVAPIELGDARAGFEPVAVDAFTWDGQVYAVPYAIENIALIRNTDLAPEAPATWDDMIAMANDAGTQFPVLLQVSADGDAFHMYPFQTSFGAPVFEQNADGSYNSTLAMGGANGEAFANWLSDQGAAGVLSADVTYDIATEQFNQGNSPFVVGGPWMLSSFTNVPNIAIDPLPTAGGETASPFVGVQGFCVSSQSQNALVANDFLVNSIGTEDAQVALAAAGDRPPALTAAQATAFANDTSGFMQGFSTVGATGVPMPSIPEMNQVWAFWGVTQADIIEGVADPAATWDQMVTDVRNAIG